MNMRLHRGIIAVREGDFAKARILLAQAVIQDAANVKGWLWLSRAAHSNQLREWCLSRAVILDPDPEFTKAGLLQYLDPSTARALSGMKRNVAPAEQVHKPLRGISPASPADSNESNVGRTEPDTSPGKNVDLSIVVFDEEPGPEPSVELSPAILEAIFESETGLAAFLTGETPDSDQIMLPGLPSVQPPDGFFEPLPTEKPNVDVTHGDSSSELDSHTGDEDS